MSWDAEPPLNPPEPETPHCQCGARRADDCICATCPECGDLTGRAYGEICVDCEEEDEDEKNP